MTARDLVTDLLGRHYRDQPDDPRADVAVLDAMYHGALDRWSLRQALDELLTGPPADLRDLLREHAGRDLSDAAALAFLERVRLLVFTSYRPPVPLPDDDAVLRDCQDRLLPFGERLAAIEAKWDGDTSGWHCELWAVERTRDGFREHRLRTLTAPGGDIRVFGGAVPRWPEAALAQRIGATLGELFGAPFHFPAPDDPSDAAPSWLDVHHARERGVIIEHAGRTFLARPDPEDTFRDLPGRLIEVFDAAARFHVFYALGQADRPQRTLVVAGREFPGLDDPLWRRVHPPRWDDAELTPELVQTLVAWCLAPDRESEA